MLLRFTLLACLVFVAGVCPSHQAYGQSALSLEVFQVLDLPLTIHEAALVKSERGGLLVKLVVGNSSEVKLVGLRYSLVSIDAKDQAQVRVNRTEGLSIPAYASKTLTFKTPVRLKPRDGERLILMVEQVVSPEWIWEVVKAKDALEAYARGDYSVTPAVMRMVNQVDAPVAPRVIYRLQRNEEY
ncbi:MAG TPA: hypothetical protein VFI24_18235 [Pyrinomonadaceae bacterium]|nr:hypothetical protein [Pyrinomonadaceae bacterium]